MPSKATSRPDGGLSTRSRRFSRPCRPHGLRLASVDYGRIRSVGVRPIRNGNPATREGPRRSTRAGRSAGSELGSLMGWRGSAGSETEDHLGGMLRSQGIDRLRCRFAGLALPQEHLK